MRRLRVRGGEDPGEERRLPQEVLQLPQVQQGAGNYKWEHINWHMIYFISKISL